MPAKKAIPSKTKTTTKTTKTARTTRPLKRAAKAAQETLPLEPKPLTGEIMERWHKDIARVAGRISLTLARRRRPPDLVDDIVLTLAAVLEEAKTHQ